MTPTACAAALEPHAARVQGESSISAHPGVSATSRPGTATWARRVFFARQHGARKAASAARMTPTVCAAALEPHAARVQGEPSTSAHPGVSATTRPGTATWAQRGSSARQHGARKAASAARMTPTVCAAALEPPAARVRGEPSTSAHPGVSATSRPGTATWARSQRSLPWGSSARQLGARKAASAARTTPTVCAAALEPPAARGMESSTSALPGVSATKRPGIATREAALELNLVEGRMHVAGLR